MGVVAISMVKDEADIIEHTVRRMADQVDRLLIADNGSTDGTRETLHALAEDLPLSVIDDPEVGYYQSRKMSHLAALAARDHGAAIVVPFDADEVWYSPHGRIADVLPEHPTAAVFTAELYDHVPSGHDIDHPDPTIRIGWRRVAPAPLGKVASRPRAAVTIHQGNHGASYGEHLAGQLIVRHFPIRSAEQMIRKARNGGAAYAATDLPEDAGKHWRDWSKLTDDQLHEAFETFYFAAAPHADRSLIFDPAP